MTGRDTTSGSEPAGRPAHSIRPTLDLVDLSDERRGLMDEPQWTDGDRNAKTLLKADSLRVVLTALRAGAVMENEDPDEPVAVQGLAGSIEIEVDGERATIEAGRLATLAGGSAWTLRATADSLVLLVLGRGR